MPTTPPPLLLHSFPELERPRLSKVLRTAAFVYPFLYDNIPLFYRVSRGGLGSCHHHGGPRELLGVVFSPPPHCSPSSPQLIFCFWSNGAWNEAVAGYCYHLLFALLTGFLFTSHLPERLAPGRFDYIGEQQPPQVSPSAPQCCGSSPPPQSNPLQQELGEESQHPG